MTVRLKTIRLAVAICVLVTLLACGLKTPGDRGTPSPAFTPTREFPVLSPTTDVRR